ncbi:MAG: LCP family protein [Candidatus Melainabacteria bacterium]
MPGSREQSKPTTLTLRQPGPNAGRIENPPARPPRRINLFRLLLVTMAFTILTSLAALMILKPEGIEINLPFSKPGKPLVLQSPLNRYRVDKVLLIMGVDATQSHDPKADPFVGTRTDTMLLVRLNSHNSTASIVSIPRDSKVYMGFTQRVDKINAAHALGGPELAVNTVEQSFGIPIDNFIVVNFAGVKELVDAIGGIDLYVDKRMVYRDRTAKLDINFEPGQHHLTGQNAMEYLRFRHDQYGDIGRVRRQQKFLFALATKLKDPWTFSKVPELVRLTNQYVKTDLSFDQMITLAGFAHQFKPENIRTATLPGTPVNETASYWIIDPVQAQAVLDRLILGNEETAPATASKPAEADPLRVGILYDGGLPIERLDELTAAIEAQGFQVKCKSRARQLTTQIIEHTSRIGKPDTSRLRKTDRALGGIPLTFAPVGTTFEANTCSSRDDYTIMLGTDVR